MHMLCYMLKMMENLKVKYIRDIFINWRGVNKKITLPLTKVIKNSMFVKQLHHSSPQQHIVS